MELNPHILLKLNRVRTRNDVAQVWLDHWRELDGWLFVLSESDEAGPRFMWPARLDLQGKGFLRSAFAYDGLWFTNTEILAELSQERNVDVPIDYSIGFDVNAATYLLAMMEGRKPDIVKVFQEVLRELAGAKFNWDVFPYLDERFEDMVAGRDLDSIWRTILATERFAACNQQRFASTGEVVIAAGEEEAIAKSREILGMYHDVLAHGRAQDLRRQHGALVAIILKIVSLERLRPGPQFASHKVAALIEFMHSRLHCLFFLLIWAGGEFFRQGSAFRPLQKLNQHSRADLNKTISNIAWDFLHVISRQSMSTEFGREHSFHVPYLLTFDRDIAALYDGFPQRGCLLGPNKEGPYFVAATTLDSYLFSNWPDLRESISWVFFDEARTARQKARPASLASVEELLSELRTGLGINS